MIVFPWLVLAMGLLLVAFVLASTPSGARWLRSRRAEAFVYPSLRAVAIMLVASAVVLVVLFVLVGPRDG